MIQSVNTKPDSTLNLSWRDQRYRRFYEVVDYLVQELQEHVWIKTGMSSPLCLIQFNDAKYLFAR